MITLNLSGPEPQRKILTIDNPRWKTQQGMKEKYKTRKSPRNRFKRTDSEGFHCFQQRKTQ